MAMLLGLVLPLELRLDLITPMLLSRPAQALLNGSTQPNLTRNITARRVDRRNQLVRAPHTKPSHR